jgi:hypothetical protein
MIHAIVLLGDKAIHQDYLRIIDFYQLFPHRLEDVRLPNRYRGIKRRLGALRTKFNDIPQPRAFLRQIKPIQETVIISLAAKGLIDPEAEAERRMVQRTARPLPSGMREIIEGRSAEEKEVVSLMVALASEIPLQGPDGMKVRTNLLEYRYDP